MKNQVLLVACLMLSREAVASANHPEGFVPPVPSETLRLYPREAPGFVPGGRTEWVTNERFRDVSVPMLFVYLPERERATGTALIICAGGGYASLAMCLHVDNAVKVLVDRGIAVFGLKYRTAYGTNLVSTDACADGLQAIRLVRSRAKAWGVDPSRIGLQGYSAGANLCLNILTAWTPGDLNAGEPLARISSRPDFVAFMSLWPNGKKADAYPIRAGAPPCFFATALDDTIAPPAFTREILEKARSQGASTQLDEVSQGGHGAFHHGMAKGPGEDWPNRLFLWLEKMDRLPPGR